MTDELSGEDLVRGPRRNWWKVAFFVTLFAFEIAREMTVLAMADKAQPNSDARLFIYDGYVLAQGSWKRIDGGERLVPGTVTIECQRETGKCVEAWTMISDGFVYAPELDWFDADFATDAVSYVNDVPNCVRYSVRLDLKMEKVFAIRDRKPAPTDARCSNMEQRIEMQLGDGYEPGQPVLDGHFVPLFSVVAAVAKLF